MSATTRCVKLTSSLLDLVLALVLLGLLTVTLLSTLNLIATPWAVVGSYSMVPTLEIGDLVLLSWTVDRADALLGKVVVYRTASGEEIVHRVVAVYNESAIRTKGDANPVPDPRPVRVDNIEGVVVLVVPHVGFPTLVLRGLFSETTLPGSLFLTVLAGLYVLTLLVLDKTVRED